MLESLSGNLVIKDFLYLYPRSQWARCSELVLVIGINSIQSKYSGFVSISELETISQGSPLSLAAQIPGIKAQLNHMFEDIENFNSNGHDEMKRSSSVTNYNAKKPPKSSYTNKKEIKCPVLVESTPKFRVLEDGFNKHS